MPVEGRAVRVVPDRDDRLGECGQIDDHGTVGVAERNEQRLAVRRDREPLRIGGAHAFFRRRQRVEAAAAAFHFGQLQRSLLDAPARRGVDAEDVDHVATVALRGPCS